MVKDLIQQWDKNKDALEKFFKENKQDVYCNSYLDILKAVFTYVLTDKEYSLDKITVVDDGYYKGTQIFLIPENTYQPSIDEYIITHNYYGSCSGCDTLQAIYSYEYDKPTKEQVDEYMILALHLVQNMKILKEEGY